MKKTVSIALKALIFCAATAGLWLCFAGSDKFMGGGQMLLYFTIQSNIWIAVTAAVGAIFMLSGKTPGEVYRVAIFIFTVAIFLTGTVYCFVLAPTMKDMSPWALSQVLVHVVVPAASVADYLIYDRPGMADFSYKKGLFVLIPPLYYVIFAATGFLCGWDFGGGQNYPYFFLNWGSPAGAFGFCRELPFFGIFYWIVLLGGFVYGVGALFLRAGKPKKAEKR